MAIIYTYPVKTSPVDDDLVLISDSADKNNTKQVKISSMRGATVSGVADVNIGTSSASTGVPLVSLPNSGNVIITSKAYDGTSNVGHVPAGGSATTFLRGDGSWVIPTNTVYEVMSSNNNYAAGLVLAGAADHENNFLRKDGTWAIPVGTGISFSGTTANGIATFSSTSIANVSSNLTIDNTNKKLNIGSTYSIQDSSAVFKIGGLSSTQSQESIEFHINGTQKVKIDEDGRLVSSAGSAANPNLKLGAGNDGVYGTTDTVQLITNGTSKISISDGNTADIQMNDLVEFGYGLKFGATGETLSSYEEGTWTPVMFQSSSPSVTATGYYIKIGKKVTAFFTLVCTTGGSAEILNARISGLPFNAYSGNGYKAGVSIAENTATASNQKYIAGAPGGATTLDLKVFTSGTDYQYAQGTWPNSQGNFTVSGSYTYHAQS